MKCFPLTFNEISVQVNITTKIDKDIGIPRIPENLQINMNSIYEKNIFRLITVIFTIQTSMMWDLLFPEFITKQREK